MCSVGLQRKFESLANKCFLRLQIAANSWSVNDRWLCFISDLNHLTQTRVDLNFKWLKNLNFAHRCWMNAKTFRLFKIFHQFACFQPNHHRPHGHFEPIYSNRNRCWKYLKFKVWTLGEIFDQMFDRTRRFLFIALFPAFHTHWIAYHVRNSIDTTTWDVRHNQLNKYFKWSEDASLIRRRIDNIVKQCIFNYIIGSAEKAPISDCHSRIFNESISYIFASWRLSARGRESEIESSELHSFIHSNLFSCWKFSFVFYSSCTNTSDSTDV